MRRVAQLALALAALSACSLDTQSLVAGGPPDAATDVVDATADVVDASAVAGRSAVGLWRIVSLSVLGATTTDTSDPTRINGLVDVRQDSVSLTYGFVRNDRAHLRHNLLVCTSPREIDVSGHGYVGRLDDAHNTFTVTEGASSPTVTFAWMGDARLALTYRVLGVDVVVTLERLSRPMTLGSYVGQFEIEFGDGVCARLHDSDTSLRAVLLWERARDGVGVPQGATSALSPMTSGGSTFALTSVVTLTGRPPAEAIGRADGVEAAIAYLVVFQDANRNGTLDHAYTGAAENADRVLGVSNVAVAWRGAGVTHTGRETSSFIDTFEGYQTVALGPDSRSSGGSSPWSVDSTGAAVHAGCFAEDLTRAFTVSGLVQALGVTSALPRLLR